MKCKECCGDGYNLRIIKKGNGYTTERVTCEHCNGTGEVPMTEPKLKPCPFCGGKVKVTNLDGNIHYGRSHWCVVCWDCELFFGYDTTYGGIYKTKQGCADDWNKRVVAE